MYPILVRDTKIKLVIPLSLEILLKFLHNSSPIPPQVLEKQIFLPSYSHKSLTQNFSKFQFGPIEYSPIQSNPTFELGCNSNNTSQPKLREDPTQIQYNRWVNRQRTQALPINFLFLSSLFFCNLRETSHLEGTTLRTLAFQLPCPFPLLDSLCNFNKHFLCNGGWWRKSVLSTTTGSFLYLLGQRSHARCRASPCP